MLPELVNAYGAVVPFDYGANKSRVPRELDYPLLLPGQSLVIPLDATVTLQTESSTGKAATEFWDFGR